MSMYLLLVAVLNVGLGFLVAAYLGRRYQLVLAAGEPWFSDIAGEQDEFDTRPEEQTTGVTEQSREPEPPSGPGLETSESEAMVEALRLEIEQYNDQLIRADEQLALLTEAPSAVAIKECLDLLLDTSKEYQQHCEKMWRDFDEGQQPRPEIARIRDSLQEFLEKQDRQVEAGQETIKNLDHENGLEESVQEIVDVTRSLLDINRQLRDDIQLAVVEVARSNNRLEQADEAEHRDALTGLWNRIGLEAKLHEWWRNDPERDRALSFALIDIDHFADVGQQHGYKAGDGILRALPSMLDTEGSSSTVSRFSGQQFVLLFPDTGVLPATDVVEQIRQTIEMTRFHYRGSEIRITVSCAVTEVLDTETLEQLVARADATLHEAKQHGRNRTFMHDGESSTPVLPHDLALEEKRITL